MKEQWQINDGYSDMGISWEWMKSITSGKATDNIADHKVYPPRENESFGKMCMCQYELNSFPILKGISDEMGDVKGCNFLNVA